MRFYMTASQWKTACENGEAPEEAILLKGYDASLKLIDDAETSIRRVRITISTGSVDRDRDTISVAGWHIDEYRKNPVVLWAHDYGALPIARALEIHRDESKLSAVDQFADRETYPFADTVYQMIKAGYINASSVGFRPRKTAYNEDRGGYDFLEQDLLEHSIVPVPANAEALIEARSVLGADIMQPMIAWCEEALDNWYGEKGIWLRRSQIEEAWKSLRPAKLVSIPKTETLILDGTPKQETQALYSKENDGVDFDTWLNDELVLYTPSQVLQSGMQSEEKEEVLGQDVLDTMKAELSALVRQTIATEWSAITGRLDDGEY